MAVQRITTWLGHAWDPESFIEERAREYIGNVQFDTMIGTGVSGAVIVPTLARLFKVEWAVVRKDNDGSHGWNTVEGRVGESWLFVDDLISTGTTMRRVRKAMDHDHHSEFVGAYLYDDRTFYNAAQIDRNWPMI